MSGNGVAKGAGCACVSLLITVAVLPFAIIHFASLSLDPTSSATRISSMGNDVGVRADLDLHWRLGIPFWGDVTMITEGTDVKLTSEKDHMTSKLTIPNPSSSKMSIKPMVITLMGPASEGRKGFVEVETENIDVHPDGTEADTVSYIRVTDLSFAERVVTEFLAKGEGGDVTLSMSPQVGFLQFHMSKVMNCKVTELHGSSALQLQGGSAWTKRRLLFAHRRHSVSQDNVGVHCTYVGNAWIR
mmetsp:Transcript_29651/g.78522  ORF Transcript_29651/g.78522 Transcript_29651/m.78522 type:complete len:244 (-) Transcript_29651:79-810(-)